MPKPVRSRSRRATGTETVEENRTAGARSTSLMTWFSVVLAVAGAAALATVLVDAWIHPEDSSRDELTSTNELLVTQQLDAVFNAISQRTGGEDSNAVAYKDLVDTFYSYDKRFVATNQDNPDARLALGYASKRLGRSAGERGDFSAAADHFRFARDAFAHEWMSDPTVLGLYVEWLNSHMQIIVMLMERGDFDSARQEYAVALRIIGQANTFSAQESSKILSPSFRSLAFIGIDLQLCAAALVPARMYVDSTSEMADRNPGDATVNQYREEAIGLLQHLQTLASGVST